MQPTPFVSPKYPPFLSFPLQSAFFSFSLKTGDPVLLTKRLASPKVRANQREEANKYNKYRREA